jgi:lactoylglutathione lyase
MKLDGLGIFVKDMAVMIRFYRDVLGFEIKEEENATNVFLEKDGTLFLLYRRTDFEKMVNRKFKYVEKFNGHSEMALSVKNYAAVDETYKQVIEKGASSILEPTTEPWGQRTCYIADPEGNLIEIGSFVKE